MVSPDEQALARSEHQKDYAAHLLAKEQRRQRRMDPPLKARDEKEKEKEKKKQKKKNELIVSVKEEEMETGLEEARAHCVRQGGGRK